MSRLISSLPLGSKIKEPLSGETVYVVIANNHFMASSTLCMLETSTVDAFTGFTSPTNYDNNGADIGIMSIFNALNEKFKSVILDTSIDIQSVTTSNQKSVSQITRKMFAPSIKEFLNTQDAYAEGTHISYLSSPARFTVGGDFWTRSAITNINGSLYFASTSSTSPMGQITSVPPNQPRLLSYLFNLPSNQAVTNTVQSDGTYHLVFNAKPSTPAITTVDGKLPSADISNPINVSVNPIITWTYQDPDSDPQSQINVVVDKEGSEVYNQTITQTATSFNIPALEPAKVHGIKIRVKDNQGNWSDFSGKVYILTGNLPNKPSINKPLSNQRTSDLPVIEFDIGTDIEDAFQHFKLKLERHEWDNENNVFSDIVAETLTIESKDNQIGWEVYNGSWSAMPSGGVKQSQYSKARYTVQSALTKNNKYNASVAPYDVEFGIYGEFSDLRGFRCGNKIEFLNEKFETADKRATEIQGVYNGTSHKTGVILKMEVANNANDINPTWEDMTNAVKTAQLHTFTNTTKTSATWAIQIRVTVEVDETITDDVFVRGIAYSANTI